MVRATTDRPVRVGVFTTTTQATRAIDALLAAGFTKDEISVICSDERREEFFADFPHPPLPEEHLAAAVATGGTIGAVIGGLTAVAAAVTTGGVALVAAGPIVLGLGGGAVAGGFIGAMTTRGVTKEMADFYDQAVTRGKILVAIEDEKDNTPRLAVAEKIFNEAGAEPVPLTEG
jgi:hypothetical protein